jgi:acetyl-CoA carboxylase biotin carboxyl carrier protein
MPAMHARATDAILQAAGETYELRAPGPGWFLPSASLRTGAVLTAGAELGQLEQLGRRTLVRVPAGAHGVVVPGGVAGARVAVSYKDVLCALDPAGVGATSTIASAAAAVSADGLVFRAPSSGRFYSRPGPGKPAFVEVGAIVGPGQTVCMLEVMKTFHRVSYGGAGLPERARVVALLVADEADVNQGDALLRLEPADAAS